MSFEHTSNEVSFMIVGTPRSGTTFAQRIICELPGVRVPQETHFFSVFLPSHPTIRPPLDAQTIRELIHRYLRSPTSRDLELDPGAVVTELGGECSSIMGLFDAIVACLAGGGTNLGEKTPSHLHWWRPIAAARTSMRFIAVVRDPRAVVVSNLRVPWGMRSAGLLAERWRADSRCVLSMVEALGGSRALVVHFEDIVEETGQARTQIARFLGLPDGQAVANPPASLFHEWESNWKALATQAARAERAGAWRNEISDLDRVIVESICRDEMEAFGYQTTSSGKELRLAGARGLPLHRLKFRWSWERRSRAIRSVGLGRAPVQVPKGEAG